MEWLKSQNAFSVENRRKFSHNQRYRYYKNNERKHYKMGAYRYSIDCKLFAQHLGKDLEEDGIDKDGKAYFWNFFYSSCTFEKNPELYADSELKKDSYIVNKIKKGQWKFPHQFYDNIRNYIKSIKLVVKSNQKFIVYLPKNKFIEKEAERQYLSVFIDFLKEEHITYVIGKIDNIKEEVDKQLVVLVIDLITNHERLEYIVHTLRTSKEQYQPILSFFSLMKIHNTEECLFRLEIIKHDKEKEEKHTITTHSVRTPDYDDEELIMRSLMGYGPDPEIFGF